MAWPRKVAVIGAGLTAAMLLVAIVLVVQAPSASRVGLLAVAAVLGAISGLSGVLVSRAQPHGSLGPLLTVPGLVAVFALTEHLAEVSTSVDPPGAAYVTAASQGAWVLTYAVVAILLLMFPDGRAWSRRDRLLLIAIGGLATVFMITAATAPGPFLPPDQATPHVFGTAPAWLATAATAICLPGLLVTLILLVLSLRRRFRGAEHGRRTQFKWLALLAALLPVTLLSAWCSYAVTGDADVVLAIGFVAMYTAVPAVVALAVLRPTLFDVDRVLASAATHAALTAVLLAVFTGGDLAAGLVVTRAAPVAGVAATALCAIMLLPLRGRLQRGVDRWLYPTRKAAYLAIDRLHRDTAAGHAQPEQLVRVLQDALGDPHLQVAYVIPSSGQIVDRDGALLDPAQWKSATAIRLGTEQIGALLTGSHSSPDLRRDIAAHAVPLVETARLRIELRTALHQVHASRARLLQVGDEERVRLERDLHDGAQQRLVSLGMALRLAQRRLSRGEGDAYGVLDAAVAELGTAVSELRRIAHGIRPACLDDGLAPALAGLIRGAPIPISLHVRAEGLADNVETAAYYIAAEAITNAVKHASADHVHLDVDARGSMLYVRIADDGIGGAVARDGSGLTGLADRVGASGGTLAINSAPGGGGTVIEAVLPCASS